MSDAGRFCGDARGRSKGPLGMAPVWMDLRNRGAPLDTVDGRRFATTGSRRRSAVPICNRNRALTSTGPRNGRPDDAHHPTRIVHYPTRPSLGETGRRTGDTSLSASISRPVTCSDVVDGRRKGQQSFALRPFRATYGCLSRGTSTPFPVPIWEGCPTLGWLLPMFGAPASSPGVPHTPDSAPIQFI